MQMQESACLDLESKRERQKNICRLCKATAAQLQLLCYRTEANSKKLKANCLQVASGLLTEQAGIFVLA